MPPATNDASLHLLVQPGLFFVSRYGPTEVLPVELLQALASSTSSRFLSITRTQDEVSVVGQCHETLPSKLEQDTTWRCFKIAGPLDFGLTGIMADLTAPLKSAKLSVFAISTWDTDYLLVKEKTFEDAVRTLEGDGWTVIQ